MENFFLQVYTDLQANVVGHKLKVLDVDIHDENPLQLILTLQLIMLHFEESFPFFDLQFENIRRFDQL